MMTSYEAIENRRSVRKYEERPLPDTLLTSFNKYIDEIDRLDSEISCQIKVVNSQEQTVKGLFCVNAPYYFLLFVKKEEADAFFEAGYLAEQLVLYLTAKGIGTCYQGGAKVTKSVIPEGYTLAIAVAFGYAATKLYKTSARIKRLPLKQTCLFKETPDDDFRIMLKAARMAPSALNLQPTRLIVYADKIRMFAKQKKSILAKYFNNELDAGIVFCHIAITAEELWVDVVFVKEDSLLEKESKNLRYLMTIKKA